MFIKYFRPRSLRMRETWPADGLVAVLARDTLEPAEPTDMIWPVETLDGCYKCRVAVCELFDTQESGIQLEQQYLESRARHISQLAEQYVRVNSLDRVNSLERAIRKECHARTFGWLDLFSQLDTIKLCQEMASFSTENSAMLLTVFLNRLVEWRAGKDVI